MKRWLGSCCTRKSKLLSTSRTVDSADPRFYTFPSYIENSTFGISCDAFAAMKVSFSETDAVAANPKLRYQDCLTRHKQMVAQYLEANYDRFFSMANALILSNNYVTKRQSLKMLGEILLDRSNYNIMTRYISFEGNLKMMMNFLRDKSRNIQYEAFHVFKVSHMRLCPARREENDSRRRGREEWLTASQVFVANPNKPPQIVAILRRNKDKLLSFLKEFHNDKDGECD